jgi:hypothetical protein
MDAYIVAIMTMIVLAVVLLGSEFLMRRWRSRNAGAQAGRETIAFKDCYDLGVQDAEHQATRSFRTMCSNWPGA